MARRKFTKNPILSNIEFYYSRYHFGHHRDEEIPSATLEELIRGCDLGQWSRVDDAQMVSSDESRFPFVHVQEGVGGKKFFVIVHTEEYVYTYYTYNLDDLICLGESALALMHEVFKPRSRRSRKASTKSYQYPVEYYLNTACAERRSTTIDDVEEDYIVDTIKATDDYDACIKAICLINNDDDDDYYEDYREEYPSLQECIQHFENTDFGDGGAFLMKLTRPDGSIIYDSGISEADLLGDY